MVEFITYYHQKKENSKKISILLRYLKLKAKGTKLDFSLPKQKLCVKAIIGSHIFPSYIYLWVWNIIKYIKLLNKHSHHKVLNKSCQFVAKLEFDKIQIVEAIFILNKTINLDHGNFCQLQIF